MNVRRIVVTLAVLTQSGCWWSHHEEVLSVVWSEDDAEQAFVVGTWEIESGLLGVPEGARTRNRKHHLYLQSANGSQRRDLYGEKPEHGFGRLHYMNASGYLVAGYQDGSGIRYERITPTGSSQVIATMNGGPGPCGTFEVIPSPNGDTLAVIRRLDAPPTSTGPPPSSIPACFPGTVQVELRDATSLAVRAGPFSWAVNQLVDSTWTPAGELIVTSMGQAWRIDAQSGPLSTTMPGCLAPKTTSSNVSSSGVQIEPGTPDDPIAVVSRNVSPFGCQ